MIAWWSPWEFSPLLVFVIAAAGLLYIRGSKRCYRGWRRNAAFWAGLVLLYAVSQTQFDYYAQHQFFVHRIQHVVLHHIAPFLIVLGHPLAVIAAGVPPRLKMLCARAGQFPPLQLVAGIFLHPATQIALFAGLVTFWLIPDIHFIAMLDWRYYRLMNAGMIVTGLTFWGLALSPFGRWAARYGTGWRVAMILAVIPPQIATGLLLFTVPRDLYPVYSICGRAFGGISPLADQQLGGMILWVPATMMSVLALIILLRRTWFTEAAQAS